MENIAIVEDPKGYSEKRLWNKIGKYAKKAGRELVGKLLQMYYCFQDRDTPVWAKGAIFAAIAYFVSPADAIPDFIPVVGFSDDLGVIVTTLASISMYIKEEHKQKVKKKIDSFFS